eukprot:CAMPEP_0178386482 /NCGR_PEP_ID=MMETSP0689_2-20121128/8586_1 /TAXON_ID=160604 /ORGANISM="Amphidinium massartii, Strain CS-259" /LENGTH=356 /DNA_ID=CAMNT_0020006827 /DNA_START=281 /DNA_END=1351 /DNA_ORIENTATION=+
MASTTGTVLCTAACESFMLGDGFCHEVCNNAECGFDNGDCVDVGDDGGGTWNAEDLTCGCTVALGNGVCDPACNTAPCNYDGGDCSQPSPTPAPATGCQCTGSSWLGDGICDDDCNTEVCNFDEGDCLPKDPPKSTTVTTLSSTSTHTALPSLTSTTSTSTSESSHTSTTLTSSTSTTTSPPEIVRPNCSRPSGYYPVDWTCDEELQLDETCVVDTIDHPCVEPATLEFMCVGNFTARPDGTVEVINISGNYAVKCQVCGIQEAEITRITTSEPDPLDSLQGTSTFISGFVRFGPNILDGSVAEEDIVGYQVYIVDGCMQMITAAGSMVSKSSSPGIQACCESDRYEAPFEYVEVR